MHDQNDPLQHHKIPKHSQSSQCTAGVKAIYALITMSNSLEKKLKIHRMEIVWIFVGNRMDF